MILQGTVVNGVVVLDQNATLPEGMRVCVTPAVISQPAPPTLGGLLKHAGALDDMPADFSAQHDHYIHGTPKR